MLCWTVGNVEGAVDAKTHLEESDAVRVHEALRIRWEERYVRGTEERHMSFPGQNSSSTMTEQSEWEATWLQGGAGGGGEGKGRLSSSPQA